MFSQLSNIQKQTIRLLSLGTLLEYFDLFLYAHMAVILNDIFFPPTTSSNQSWLASFGFCSAFLFRPIGALVLGYIGDTYGRKKTVVITTLLTSITCCIMAFLPTYAQIGIQATIILLICRMLQGIASMGEMVGAQLLLTETIPLPNRFLAVGMLVIFADIGGLLAMGIAVLITSYGLHWRLVFMVGACIAVVGTLARNTLRESPEFSDASKRVKRIFSQTRQDPNLAKANPFYNQKVHIKTSLAYFLIKCPAPAIIYFAYFYSTNILKSFFQYDVHRILTHNLLLGGIQILFMSLLRTYLTTKIHPLKILNFSWIILIVFIPFLPLLLNSVRSVGELFLIQSFLVSFKIMDFPAAPIIFKNFPVFKRFSYNSFLEATAYAIIYAITSFGLSYLIDYFGYWGLLVLMVPILVGYGYGLHHFIELEKAAGRYPKMITCNSTK